MVIVWVSKNLKMKKAIILLAVVFSLAYCTPSQQADQTTTNSSSTTDSSSTSGAGSTGTGTTGSGTTGSGSTTDTSSTQPTTDSVPH